MYYHNTELMNLESYIIVNRQIAIDLMTLLKESGMEALPVDDVLVRAIAPLVLLDRDRLSDEEKSKCHVRRSGIFLNGRSTLARYRNYEYDAIIEAVTKEWLPKFGSLDEKRAFLSDIKVIGNVTDEGEVVFKDYLVDRYLTMNYSLKYGTTPYQGNGRKLTSNDRKPQQKLTEFRVDEEIADKLAPFIEHFKSHFDFDIDHESYKWNAVTMFQKTFNIDTEDLAYNIKESMKHSENLLAGPYYYPMSMLSQFAQYSKDETRRALKDLYDEKIPLTNRIENYLNFSQEILASNKARGNFKPNDNHQQSVRAISVYLSLMYPNKHYLFKTSVWNMFKKETGLDYPPLTHFVDTLTGYYHICEQIRKVLIQDKELVALHDKAYPDDISDYHILTQDFMYYVACHYQDLKDVQ